MNDKILVIGACGQIGIELTQSLRGIYSMDAVIAADIREPHSLLKGTGIFEKIDVLDKENIAAIVKKYKINQIYLLAALLSAASEKNPLLAWQINLTGLLNVLEIATVYDIQKIFWPSSIAVFGPNSPKINCPQHTVIEPATVYGISKQAGEQWCNYYFLKHKIDVRSLRYPGLISHATMPDGGTTDYANTIFKAAIEQQYFDCYLNADTCLPMLYMPDAIRATLELMETPWHSLSIHNSYNIAGVSFSPQQLACVIQQYIPNFTITYNPDFRQTLAAGWPQSIDDSVARTDWQWEAKYGLEAITKDMLHQLNKKNN